MNRIIMLVLLMVVLVVGLLLVGNGISRAARPDPKALADFNTRLEPGVFHSWPLRSSEAAGGYLVEVNPLHKPRGGEGSDVQTAFVRPEFDGELWMDVLRVQLPEGSAALNVNVRVYDSAFLPLFFEFDTVLQPGVWHGFLLSEASANQAYVVDVTPLRAGYPGDHIARVQMQPEHPGGVWGDVLRIESGCLEELPVHVRVYSTASLPVVADFNIALSPGEWQGYLVQPSKSDTPYVVEVTPNGREDVVVDRALVQTEFDGRVWNDVVRLMATENTGQPPLPVNVRVYAMQVNP